MLNLTRFNRVLFQFRSFSSSKLIDVVTDENTGITTLAMKRSPVNSLNTELLTDISSVLDELQITKSKGLILTSKIPNIFSAGLDLTELYKCDVERLTTFWVTVQNTWLKLYSAPFATVALVNGHSPAGGCMLAMSCDYRVMLAPNYTIGLNEAKIGIPVPFWFMDVMKSIIGPRKTELSVLPGRMYKSNEAFAIGLVDEIVESQSEAESKVALYLKDVNSCAAEGRALTKREHRGDILEKFLKKRDEECQALVALILSPKTQKKLELYFEAIKKKN